MSEQDGLDLDWIIAKHSPDGWTDDGQGWCPSCGMFIVGPGCEAYRLASLALDLQGKVARLEKAGSYDNLATMLEMTERERDKSQAGLAAVEAFAQSKAIAARAVGDGWRERQWLDLLIITERAALADPTPAARCLQQTPFEALSEPTCTRPEGHVGAHLFTSYDGKTPLETMPK